MDNKCLILLMHGATMKNVMVVDLTKFLACYGTPDFITELTTASQLLPILSQNNPLHILRLYLFSIHFAAQTV